ncbi:SMP-30/gluconolactonase/LRE family protein [Neorhizobium sp. NCHU2750]|uniref:SMP-30/gluconolactonase/LRE family protein n=1 Tax=Neorhizobium sp. NCHU2750 TaxID=1825976 RepID=UPI000E735D6A|nr:gluconolaconase [Neorhizobium sp. NCHU2750]
MASIHPFKGSVLSSTLCELGEGASFEAETNTLWWCNILGKEIYSLELSSGTQSAFSLPVMASVVARIDSGRQLIASDKGLFIRNRATGELTPHGEIEPGRDGNRSNDGRMHASGSLWIGTMGRTAADGAGAIYHVARGVVTKLFDTVSIPNSICFSPDAATAYFVDTRANKMMTVAVDPATGLPSGKPTLFIDGSADAGGIDGSICDADGHIWNARWGEAALDHYSADGSFIQRYQLPAKRTTCPAFIDNGRIAVTSAWEGLDEASRTADPMAGATFVLDVGAKAKYDPAYLP